MERASRMSNKTQRVLIILLAAFIYITLVMLGALDFFSYHTIASSPIQWIPFGFFVLVALLFFSVGSLVWLYARDRRVALLLFCFSLIMMGTLIPEIVSEANIFLTTFGQMCSSIAIPLGTALLLLFPRNYLLTFQHGKSLVKKANIERLYDFAKLLKIYLWLITTFSAVNACLHLLYNTHFLPNSSWLKMIFVAYYAIGLPGILILIISSYYQSSSMRERQQLRLFVCGVILSITPILLFDVLPQILGLSSYAADYQYTSAAFSLFPLALGYSILRYQVLVLDSYIRRAASYIVGIICLAILVYLAVVLGNVILANRVTNHIVFYIVCVVAITAALSPIIWWLSRVMTDRLFFSEILHYRRLIDKPTLFAEEVLNLESASHLLTMAAVHALETIQACVFMLDESNGSYSISPKLSGEDADQARANFAQSVLQKLKPLAEGEDTLWLDESLPTIARLTKARRPLLLSEATISEENAPRGLHRYLTSTSTLGDEDWLLAPVRAQGKMIGFLVLGERGDHQSYAGPDFEVVQMLTVRFSSILETARLYARANQHAELLNNLYRISLAPGSTFGTVEDVAFAYAMVAAGAANAHAEIWFYNEQTNVLRRTVATGAGPLLTMQDLLHGMHDHDWSPTFFDGQKTLGFQSTAPLLPSCLVEVPEFPFVWLPLHKDERQLGLLVLTYPQLHFFMKEEVRVLLMFADQCVATMEDVRMRRELLVAYERQKELDYMKDRFIMTASHELRTPLTAALGYIELLNEYNDSLTVEARADFIDKARRGCDELTLLVGNLMDASRVGLNTENIKLTPIALPDAVTHVLTLLEATVEREGRAITVNLPEDLYVQADELRLRQILLNIVTNALRYSDEGTNIEIFSECDRQRVVVSIRDYGFGVPVQDQQRLFERFVRLDRDMNSSVRGTGLGLAICKQLVEAMSGQIWVESSGKEGEGSCFHFSLQHAPVDSPTMVLEKRFPNSRSSK